MKNDYTKLQESVHKHFKDFFKDNIYRKNALAAKIGIPYYCLIGLIGNNFKLVSKHQLVNYSIKLHFFKYNL